MTRWAGPAFVVLLAAALPLLAPQGALAAGWVPDCAVLAVVALAFRGTADRAAMLGVLIGALQAPWTPEPLLFRPFVLGTAGWCAARAAAGLHRERATVQMAVAAAAVCLVRLSAFVAAAIAAGDGVPWSARDTFAAARAAAAAVAVGALAAPLALACAARWPLLRPLERSFRDV